MPGEGPVSSSCSAGLANDVDAGPSPGMTAWYTVPQLKRSFPPKPQPDRHQAVRRHASRAQSPATASSSPASSWRGRNVPRQGKFDMPGRSHVCGQLVIACTDAVQRGGQLVARPLPLRSENRETRSAASAIIRRMDMDDDACYRAIATRDPRFDGRLFVAVTTTGVYCRPFCPAPTPKRENVRFFPTAAAAQEAGFRPCLRCRPETSPELAFWRGSSNTVSRALGLIEAGGLDEAHVGTLAARLGIGERQLRRLFRQHLGASPISIAQTRRILLAKQLIQDTRLPMTEVAAAAGFGSIRRFNEIFQQLYRRPPTALRRRGLTDQSVCETGAVSVKLGYRPPYDWDAILSFLRARAIPGIEAVSGSRYVRTIAIGDQHGVLVVEPAERNCLRATVRFPALRHLPAIIARVRRVFDLAADPVAIGAHLSQDPWLAPLVAARPGPQGSRRVGRIRTRRARHSRAADHRVGGDAAGRQIGCVPWREDRRSCRARPWADAGISHASATRRRRPGRDRHAAGQANRAVLAGGGCRR